MTRSSRIQRTAKADARSRLTLGEYFTPPGSRWRAVKETDGRITLHPLTTDHILTTPHPVSENKNG